MLVDRRGRRGNGGFNRKKISILKWCENVEEWNLRGIEYARSKLSISKFFLNYDDFLSPSNVKNEKETNFDFDKILQ